MSITSAWTRRPSVSAVNKRGEWTRGSRPTTTCCSATRAANAAPIACTVLSSRSRSATPRMSYSRKLRGFTNSQIPREAACRKGIDDLAYILGLILPDDQDRVSALDHDKVRESDRGDQGVVVGYH